MRVLARLAEELRADGGLLAGAVRDPDPGARAVLGPAAAAGPRARGRELTYALLVEAVWEGYALHYARPRVVSAVDRDLALLAGDRLYAFGLARLAELGDTAAVRELADVIALAATAHAAGRPALARAVWEAGAAAVGRGSSPAHAEAGARAAAGEDGAEEALRALSAGV